MPEKIRMWRRRVACRPRLGRNRCPSPAPLRPTPARSCPPESQIGTADAVATVLLLPVSLTGGVYYGGPVGARIKLIVFLDNTSLNQHQTIEGFVEIRPSDHGFDTVFDGLPNVPT